LKELERMNALLQQAVDHHNKSLMKFRGWRPWRQLIHCRKKQEQIADSAFRKCCLRFGYNFSIHNSTEYLLHTMKLCAKVSVDIASFRQCFFGCTEGNFK